MERINELLEQYKDNQEVCNMIRALGVIILTPEINAYLTTTDPNALNQVRTALGYRAIKMRHEI